SLRLVCPGSVCARTSGGSQGEGVCSEILTPPAYATNLDPVSVSFNLSGLGPNPTVLTNPIVTLRSPEQHVVYASSLAALTVPAADHGAIEIPHTSSFPEYDPGRFYRLTLEADTDGDGQYEELASIPVFNVIPATEQGIAIKQDPDGGI